MSRTATATQPPTATAPPVPRERIAMRAYERWVGRGCPAGTDVQDWIEAEAELKAEVAKTGRVVEQCRPDRPSPNHPAAGCRRPDSVTRPAPAPHRKSRSPCR